MILGLWRVIKSLFWGSREEKKEKEYNDLKKEVQGLKSALIGATKKIDQVEKKAELSETERRKIHAQNLDIPKPKKVKYQAGMLEAKMAESRKNKGEEPNNPEKETNKQAKLTKWW